MRAEIYYKLLVKTHKLVHRLYWNVHMKGNLNAVRNIVYKEQDKLPYIYGSYLDASEEISKIYRKLSYDLFIKDMIFFFKQNNIVVPPKEIKDALSKRHVSGILRKYIGEGYIEKILDYFYK
jgi:hypothetical protein